MKRPVVQPPRPAQLEDLLLWVIHRFAEEFPDHAILTGGMALRLFDCARLTNDVDYVFVPYRSKKQIEPELRRVLEQLEGAEVSVETHSKMIRASVSLDGVSIQVEANVAEVCPSEAVATAGFARSHGQPSQVVRVMALATALANKLAAWNERRLLRDLYDVYFLSSRLGASPDRVVLQARLQRVQSSLPALRGTRKMSMRTFVSQLLDAVGEIDQSRIDDELAAVLPSEELPGLSRRIRSAVVRVAERLADRG